MKALQRILLLIILTSNLQLPTSNCHAQVTIPDPNFVLWLNDHGFDSCMNGNQLDTLCPAILAAKTVFVYSYSLSSIEGVQYFKNLDSLICPINNMDSLPHLPATITYLDCDNNDITALPPLPPNLLYLNCYSNDLTGLPTLPQTLSYLYCSYNKLINLPALPDSLTDFDVTYNHNLSCLPEINKIANFYFGNTNIKCVPDYGTVENSAPPIDTFPLCTTSNPDGCFPAGVNELEVESWKLEVSPNPSSGLFTVSLPGGVNELVPSTSVGGWKLEVYNLIGKKLFETTDTRHKTQDTRQIVVDMTGFAVGIYFIKLSSATETQTTKVVKTN